ncbi:MAG: TIGR00282 family metallophosphoesterase [Oscillospiraceae bacterium]|nr:TIGR00282 family metallophosphoesterase [Oscillospiraceae bacterium]
MKILALGDVVGSIGISAICENLSLLKREYGAKFTIVNGENADMVGITPEQADTLFKAGVDVITLGNHTWGRRQIAPYIENEPSLLRPYNVPGNAPGAGYGIFDAFGRRALVINLLGRVGMPSGADNPFFAADKILKDTEGQYDFAVCDFHAEATSEKQALGFYLDGRISAVWGTHTHVQTADEKVLPDGTGFICDLGMCGAYNSVIGSAPEKSLATFLGSVPERFTEAAGPAMINGICLDISDGGRCLSVTRINKVLKG